MSDEELRCQRRWRRCRVDNADDKILLISSRSIAGATYFWITTEAKYNKKKTIED